MYDASMRAWPLFMLGVLAACAGPSVDLLVVAPHPDDESIGCGGILAEAWAGGRRALVVIVTNGDGNTESAAALAGRPPERLGPDDYLAVARLRQTQSMAAVEALGGRPEDVVFLGYPDTALARMYEARSDDPLTQPLTGRRETYGSARAARPYTHAALREDLEELLRTFRPKRIYVTDASDRHPDHRAAFEFVRDAVRSTGCGVELYAYVVHGEPDPALPVRLSRASLEAKARAVEAYLEGFPPGTLARKREAFADYARREERFRRVAP